MIDISFVRKGLRTLLKIVLGGNTECMPTNCDKETIQTDSLLISPLGANDLSRVILSRRLGLHEEMLGMLVYIQQT